MHGVRIGMAGYVWPIVFGIGGLLPTTLLMAAPTTAAKTEQARRTVHMPAFDLPESTFLGNATRTALDHARVLRQESIAQFNACPSMEGASRAELPGIRTCQAEAFYRTAAYREVRDRYAVTVAPQNMGGVYAEVFEPKAGIAPNNARRVLINVHGGGFVGGSRTTSHLESIPIAAVGRIKVVSIDYRMAPEHVFPAASEDVAAVYRELLKTYAPESIGIYGCSAGGVLTAESVAWLQKERLPRPGAVGMFCGAGSYWNEGDSGPMSSAMNGYPPSTSKDNAYFKDADPNDPLVFPLRSPEVLAAFPPSLLIASVRDIALSSVVHMHSRLVALGVKSDLHVWEGLGHAFFFDPALPESREVYAVTVKFFEEHLDGK